MLKLRISSGKKKKKKLFKPMNHSEIFLEENIYIYMITTTTFVLLETVSRTHTYQLDSELRNGHAASSASQSCAILIIHG